MEQKVSWGKESASRSRMEREITIKLNPKKAIKGFLVLAVLLAVFFMGRVSTDMAFFGSSDGTTSATIVDETAEEEVEEAEVELAENMVVVEDEEVVEEVTEEIVEEEVEEEDDEEVVTTYGGVSLAVNEMYRDWKGTYGKMTGFEFSIKNTEEGTVLPGYFVMTVDSYDDIEKRFDVPYDSVKVKSGETLTTEVAITGGFMYNPATINIEKAKIKLYLYDKSGNVMALSSQTMDLTVEE